MSGGCDAGSSESSDPSFEAPETQWVGTWTELQDAKAKSQTIVVTDSDRTLFDGTGIELRNRDYNFAFWNGPPADTDCIELDDRVTLDERQLEAIEKLLCP